MILKGKDLIGILGAVVLCVLSNIFFSHNPLLIIFLNCLLLVLSLLAFLQVSESKKFDINPVLIITLGLIPIFSYPSNNLWINFLTLLIIVCYLGILKKGFRKFLTPVIIGLVILGGLLVGQVISFNSGFNGRLTIFGSREVLDSAGALKNEAFYLPYKLRQVIYNRTIEGVYILGMAAKFVSVKNFYTGLLLANFYPLALGLFYGRKLFSKIKWVLIGSLLGIFLVIGISLSIDNVGLILMLNPLLLFFILLGLQKVNLKAYLILLVISLLLIISPVR